MKKITIIELLDDGMEMSYEEFEKIDSKKNCEKVKKNTALSIEPKIKSPKKRANSNKESVDIHPMINNLKKCILKSIKLDSEKRRNNWKEFKRLIFVIEKEIPSFFQNPVSSDTCDFIIKKNGKRNYLHRY